MLESQLLEVCFEQLYLILMLINYIDHFKIGGPRRVVLQLPDGSLMVTEMDEEQFAALEMDK